MRQADLEDRVRQVAWPAPSPDLRARILSEASVVGPLMSVTWSDRLWFSRTFRLSIAAATLVLLTAQVVAGPWGTGSLAPTPGAMARAQAIEETGLEIGLPPEMAASLALRAVAHVQPRAIDLSAWPELGLGQDGDRR